MIALLALWACGSGAAVADLDLTPGPLAGTECTVCGMMAAERPAPRGQVVHRDGTHAYLCSLGDLRIYLKAPSPHGEAAAIYVEALPEGFDPAGVSSAAAPWVAADDAWFVFGASRPTVMGLPVLSYGDQALAQAQASALGSAPVRWESVRSTPFDQVPAAATR